MHRLGTTTIQDAANDPVKLPDVDDNLGTQAEGVVTPIHEVEPPRPEPPHRGAEVSVGSLLRRLGPERAADPASVYRAGSEGQEREHSLSGTRKRDRSIGRRTELRYQLETHVATGDRLTAPLPRRSSGLPMTLPPIMAP